MKPSEKTKVFVEDMQKSREWAGSLIGKAADVPVSFLYNGQKIKGIPQAWNPTCKKQRVDANIIQTIFEGKDPETALAIRVECQEYKDFPVVEWTAWFTNEGKKPTPILQDILALDSSFQGKSPVITHCNGDFYHETGYTAQDTALAENSSLTFAPTGGRPCDGAFPYYRIGFEGSGMTIAVGWSGQWSITFTGLSEGVNIKAGQQLTHLRLMPGEKIRTPRMTILSWTGSSTRAINLWRRWYFAHILPRPNGQPLKPKLALCGTDEGEEFTASTEENQIKYINKFKKLGYPMDVWWIDAGWYPCYNENHERKWWITGSWIPDPERYPHGLKPVADEAAKYGADLLIWFEPERIQPKTKLDLERPEWLLSAKEDSNKLLNLGNPECRQWLTDHVCKLIQDNGIKIYRQDFNFEPLRHWRENDAEDRQGMNENLHIQGYYQYWDDLLDRNPGLWIDSCSSGGRRNDLETMRRSVPLHYTDYGYGNHPIKLAFHRTMYEWIPYFKECTLSWDLHGMERFDHQLDSFSFHCGMAGMMFVTLDIRRDDYDFPLGLKMIEIWQKAADLMLRSDYYKLTPESRDTAHWVAWEFNIPENGEGFIQAFRLNDCESESLTLPMKGLCQKSVYLFENKESGEVKEILGKNLVEEGFTFTLPKRSASIWFYQKKV